jgi:hypothetical protein
MPTWWYAPFRSVTMRRSPGRRLLAKSTSCSIELELEVAVVEEIVDGTAVVDSL